MTLSKRLLAGSLILVGILVLAIVLIAGSRLNQSLADDTRTQLQREARLVATTWTNVAQNADALADTAAAATSHRVTLIRTDGVVVGESNAELRGLNNHSDRPEIIAARDSGTGCSNRRSGSVGEEEMYCAVRHPLGYVRVAIPTASFRVIVREAQNDVLVAGLIAMLLAMLLATLFSRSVSRPIIALRDVARTIAAGDLDRRPSLSAPGEVGDLASAIHRMAEQLGTRLHALEREEALMLAVIESLDEGIVAVNARGEVVRVNASARRLLRIDDAPPFRDDRLPPERVLRDALRSAMAGTPIGAVETTLHDHTLAVTARPLPGGGAVLAMLDLTARRRLETVRQDFVANVSHELRTPLTVIAGFTESLSDAAMPVEIREHFLAKIIANTTRMQRIVDDLLDLARYETGGWTPRLADVEIESVVLDVFASVRSAAVASGVRLEVAVGKGADQVRADPTALRQILANLVENAVRHTSFGSVTVRSSRDSVGSGIWIAVADTGTGISREHVGRIFERFYRADPGRSRDVGGTGLGLAIVRHLVEAHGGEVKAESAVGHGTTISVFLPSK
jgi:two-component system phosphate regulon sensor histidine kinase PhoR